MIISITGHRPDKLGGYAPCELHDKIKFALKHAFLAFQPEYIISGMALGIDQWAAEVAFSLKIPVMAAVPFEGQEGKWPEASQIRFRELLSQAQSIHYVSPPGYAKWKMQVRNQWMVDNADMVLSVWDGSEGGTKNCIDYARKKSKIIANINPKTFEIGFI